MPTLPPRTKTEQGLHSTWFPTMTPAERLQYDTEDRLRVIVNVCDQWFLGARTWQETAAAVRALAERLPTVGATHETNHPTTTD